MVQSTQQGLLHSLPPEYTQYCITAPIVRSMPIASPRHFVSVFVDGKPCRMIVDNGAPFGIIPQPLFQQMWPNTQPDNVQFPLGAYNDTGINVIGKIVVSVQLGNHRANLPLYVTREGSVLILGREWFGPLGMKVMVPGHQQPARILAAFEQQPQPAVQPHSHNPQHLPRSHSLQFNRCTAQDSLSRLQQLLPQPHKQVM